MKRDALLKLIDWKKNPRRKPLILNGARQVGKTWLMKEFGRTEFENVAYVNFDGDDLIKEVFAHGYDIPRILLALQAKTRQIIDPQKTLVVFDEIQTCPKALTSLKYFCEERPDLAIVAAGSLLGIGLQEGSGFPVGKVDALDIYPMTFLEFLEAVGERQLVEAINRCDWDLLSIFKERLVEWLRTYYYVGGMPEAVSAFCEEKAFIAARNVQMHILKDYARDFAKHIPPADLPYAHMLWQSLPIQLGRENKKFTYSSVKEGLRGRQIKGALQWLVGAGLVYQVFQVSKPNLPLVAYSTEGYKLFGLDVGLLAAQCRLDERVILEGSRIFTEFKGALTEQYVQQEVRASLGIAPFYWSAEKANAEVDFLLESGMEIVPMEVKAEVNLNAKSLRVYREKFHPTISVRTSMADYRKEDWLVNLPLYAIGEIGELIKER